MKVRKFTPAKIIKKHNSLTDGYIPKPPKQVLPDRLLNALYYKFEREGEIFRITMPELKRLLGLPNEKNDRRIYEAIRILQAPIVIRDFRYKGKEVAWLCAPFLSRVYRWKERLNEFEFCIDPMVIEAIKQKGGYTPLDINICNRFRTKFGLKLYEMFRRYANLPNNHGDIDSRAIGVVAKSIEELNNMFGTNYTSPSKLFSSSPTKSPPPINRALKEIERVTGEVYHCFYDKDTRSFIFSWGRRKEDLYPSVACIIPSKSIEPFAKWYMDHFADKVNEPAGYLRKIVQRIKENTMGNIEKYYQLYLLELGKDPKSCFDPKTNKFTY
ncbi:MAG: replication initiation protein [Epsilonproteobacteria bacterium]|nr:replication initiation protein [Campylobacterota bacterium]